MQIVQWLLLLRYVDCWAELLTVQVWAAARVFRSRVHVLQVPPAVIHDTLIPMVFRMLEHGARAVMVPAASAVCALFRRLSRERHRTELLVHIIRDLAHSSSSVHRLAFVHVARAALATFSASFFCSHLLMHLLPLVHDASLAVRSKPSPPCASHA